MYNNNSINMVYEITGEIDELYNNSLNIDHMVDIPEFYAIIISDLYKFYRVVEVLIHRDNAMLVRIISKTDSKFLGSIDVLNECIICCISINNMTMFTCKIKIHEYVDFAILKKVIDEIL
jgi:hypothetical protein